MSVKYKGLRKRRSSIGHLEQTPSFYFCLKKFIFPCLNRTCVEIEKGIDEL